MGAWVADRDKRVASGQPIDANTYYNFPKPTALDTGGAGQALARGMADTGSLGSINKIASAVDAVGDKIGGSDQSFGDDLFRSFVVGVSKLSEHVGVALTGEDGVDDGKPRNAGDVADDVMEVEIHLVEGLLHALNV